MQWRNDQNRDLQGEDTCCSNGVCQTRIASFYLAKSAESLRLLAPPNFTVSQALIHLGTRLVTHQCLRTQDNPLSFE